MELNVKSLFLCAFCGVVVLSFGVLSVPVNQQYCPVIKSSDLEPGVPLGSKVIKMDEVDGQKVRLQFYFPNGNRRRQVDSSAETTTAVQEVSDDLTSATEVTEGISTTEVFTTTTNIEKSTDYDVFCSWDFRAGNDSQFLLLTFEKLSAPYSENCAEAFVAMQKDSGYESRWCGNRRQANARPMALFSRGSAKISVYRSAESQPTPSTGFTVVVQSVDASMLEGNKNALRVLLG